MENIIGVLLVKNIIITNRIFTK